MSVLERFVSKFDMDTKDRCWEWKGAKYPDGYGTYRKRGAHRFSFRLFRGDIPNGVCVCHECDNPSCVNPNHLFLGTHKENMEDKAAKNRSHRPRGQLNGRAKLKPADIDLIRKAAQRGLNQRFLGRWFGVSKSMIGYVTREENWRG